ncbi:type I restriction endonuclease subunit R [Flectobacillus roseus]
MAFNENTRVKIPAILHLCRLGYTYLPLKQVINDESTNILTNIFIEQIQRINQDVDAIQAQRVLEDVSLKLDSEDLGKAFYEQLTATSGIRLIDFKDFSNNAFHVVTEYTFKNGEEEFRPDITLFINGMPLAIIEVKKPDNERGIMAETDRMKSKRNQNPKFRKFINQFQLLVFSNNMEYDTESIVPIQGAFYATSSYGSVRVNTFKEEHLLNLDSLLLPEDDNIENLVLKDNNLSVIKHSDEFISNKEPNTPTNRVLTSLFNPERFEFFLRFGIAYVKGNKGLEKHIMRYPQLFATKAIESTIERGIKKGIIWHTQGSGKTALAFFNTHYLTYYFQRKNVVPKFYFIVDRLDLLDQAKREFSSRGLLVHTVNSKEELIKDFQARKAIHNSTGQREITVVNIQKFKEETQILKSNDYDINTQRIYFLDEVHRSYNPTGSFLANLFNADKNAIIIGLTGTPLISEDRRSKDTFGDYIHKYYYNQSISDGYTLKLIREDIETSYKIQMAQALKELDILKGGLEKTKIYADERFVEPMLKFIVNDFNDSQVKFGKQNIGAMVVCDSSKQAEKLYEIFQDKYAIPQFISMAQFPNQYSIAAEEAGEYKPKKALSAALILHDAGTKEERRALVEDFKAGKIDILFVFNMLLTGFDAPRLKKLYMGRIIKDHNLLQTLTRVNRPYKDFRFGFVVDFADIQKEFDLTNKAYFDELQQELGNEMDSYSNLFKSKEEIESDIRDIKEHLFHFDLKNRELFSRQIQQIQDKKEVLEIRKALASLKNIYNLIRLYGHFDLLEKTDFKLFNDLYKVAEAHVTTLNQKEALENNTDNTNLLNVALENIVFMFRKISENELILADQLKDSLRKTREELAYNFDPKDPEFVSLYDELKRLFKEKKFDDVTQDEMKANMGALRIIYNKAVELNRKNNLLKDKYQNDTKYARVHKRIIERGGISKRESEIHETLMNVKKEADDAVLINTRMLNNESFFDQKMLSIVIQGFKKTSIKLDNSSYRFVNTAIVKEYIDEFLGKNK